MKNKEEVAKWQNEANQRLKKNGYDGMIAPDILIDLEVAVFDSLISTPEPYDDVNMTQLHYNWAMMFGQCLVDGLQGEWICEKTPRGAEVWYVQIGTFVKVCPMTNIMMFILHDSEKCGLLSTYLYLKYVLVQANERKLHCFFTFLNEQTVSNN